MNKEQVFFSNNSFKSNVIFGLNHNLVTKARNIIITIFLVAYWISVILSFFISNIKQDILSQISNYLQLLLNTCTLTVLLMNITLVKKKYVFDQILKFLKQFDSNISALMGIKLEYKRINYQHIFALLVILIYVVYLVVYDILMNIYVYKDLNLEYFTISRMARAVYYVGLCKTMFILHSINWRFKFINKILKSEQLDVHNGMSKNENIPRIFFIMDNMKDLCQAVNLYYGSMFLMSFTTMFAVTAIQLYYCYTVIINTESFDVDKLILSTNVIFINLFYVIGISSICQQITEKVLLALMSLILDLLFIY